MIKFFFKIFMVSLIAISAVIYHNTDSGREMERRIGEEIKFDNMKERGKALYDKTIDFILLKGMGAVEEKIEKKADKLKKPGSDVQKKSEVKELIKEEERKKIEQIIENEG